MEIIELAEKTRKAMAQCLREYQWDDFDAVEIHPGIYDAEGELDHCGDNEKPDCYMIFLHLIDGGLVDLTEVQCLDAAEFIGEMVNDWLVEHSTRPSELI
jgi:hypothetical protein